MKIATFALLTMGAILLLIGGGPMAAALVVSNQVIDDGPDPGDPEIMLEWDDWAFTPRFIWPVVGGGMLMIVAGGLRLADRQSRLPEPCGQEIL